MGRDTEAKLTSEIKIEKLKHSFEMKHVVLTRQLELQMASFKTELEKQTSETLAHARDPKLPYFDEGKAKMDSYLDLRNTRRQIMGYGCLGCIFKRLVERSRA